jgi:ABC-type nitrate/sulfonate/bicarbonate transport system substrate-binding protein
MAEISRRRSSLRPRGRARRIAGISLVVPLLAAVASCSSSSTNPSGSASGTATKSYSGTINVSFPFLPITQFYPLELAKDDGIFKKYGLNVNVETVGNNAINSALESGSLQFTVTSPPLELAYEAGVPIKLIGVYGQHTATSLLVSPGIKSIKDLAGKKIGITTADAYSSIIAKYALYKAGISDNDVHFVPIGMVMPSSAIISGLVNAVDADTTQVLLAQKGRPGASTVQDFTPVVWPSGQIWGYGPWMTAHKAETAVFLKAFNEAVVMWNSDAAAAKKVISKYDATTDSKVIDALYAATQREFNTGGTPVQVPSYETESFISGVLRVTGFPKAADSYAKEGQIWTSEYWNAAFGGS